MSTIFSVNVNHYSVFRKEEDEKKCEESVSALRNTFQQLHGKEPGTCTVIDGISGRCLRSSSMMELRNKRTMFVPKTPTPSDDEKLSATVFPNFAVISKSAEEKS